MWDPEAGYRAWKPLTRGAPKTSRGRGEESVERSREMAMAGEAQVEGQGREIVPGAGGQAFQRFEKAQAGAVSVNRRAALLLEEPAEMER